MEHQLQLTPRGHAVYELMVDQGFSLEEACQRVELALLTLRRRVDEILADCSWEEVPHAVQVALDGVSSHVQGAYLDEQRGAAHGELGLSV
jgi:hypothetical protein